MKFGIRTSLFTKIMFFFVLNLVVLAAVFGLLFGLDFRFEHRLPFFLNVNRLDTLSRPITTETQDLMRSERDAVLARFSKEQNVEFYIFSEDGTQIGGPPVILPPEVASRLAGGFKMPGPVRDNRGLPPARVGPGGPPSPSFYVRSSDPVLYWSGAPIFIFDRDAPDPIRARLVASSDSIIGHGLFFNPLPWLATIGLVLLVSAAVWFPFVRGLTRTIAEMDDAAQKIAEEDFTVRVSERRGDELGRLGSSINHLASRLEGFVSGQRRFLGDISHELNSPLARMQFALGILEDRVAGKELEYVGDVREEVEMMTKLVAELLAFSKAGIRTQSLELEIVLLKPLIDRVVSREKTNETVEINVTANDSLEALAHPEMLARAIGNVVRNAVRYAGSAGPIEVSARETDGLVEIVVRDNGAGVPEDALEKLFDPFYRVETHRSRETGGTGLGLAIVRTCVEACEGRVFAANLEPRGFAITMLLKK